MDTVADAAVRMVGSSCGRGVQICVAMAQRSLAAYAAPCRACRRCHIPPFALLARLMVSDRGRKASARSSRQSILCVALAPDAMHVPCLQNPAEA